MSQTRMRWPGACCPCRKRGADNINFVTPSHVVPQLIEAIAAAAGKGLTIPICFNSNGYELVETLRLLEGIVDIYLPDFKYADEEPAVELSDAPGYPAIAEDAIGEMFRQVGPLDTDEHGIATRGVIVRHLILPGGKAGTAEVMRRLAARLGTDLDVSVMTQYFPAHRAGQCATMTRRITENEAEDGLKGYETAASSAASFKDMDELQQTIDEIKAPLDAALRDPGKLQALSDMEKSLGTRIEQLLSGHKFRFAVEMYLRDVRNEFRGFERLDESNKTAVVDSARQMVARLESFLDRVKDPLLHESEIAEEMKAQAARDLERERSRRVQQPAPRAKPPEQKGGRQSASAAPDAPQQNGGQDDKGASPSRSSRRRRRPRRRGRKPPSGNN